MAVQDVNETRTCLSEIHCKAYDSIAKTGAPTTDPLCPACLDAATPDVQALVYDYVDLAQLHEASLSQALNEKTAASKEPPMLIAAHVEALQAEMVHVLTTWETEVRAAARLSDPPFPVRAGTDIQRAVHVLLPRLRLLSLLPSTSVYRTGCEDPPEDVAGWEAVHHLQSLHRRARSALGRTRRTFWIPGECWRCDARPIPGVDGPLLRSEPRRFEDLMQVGCGRCGATRPYPDYEIYMATAGVRWPTLAAAEPAAA